MRVIFLPTLWTIVLDFIAWGIFQPGTAGLSMLIPVGKLDPNKSFFRSACWENEGEIYQRLLNIRAWKRLLPSGGAWLNKQGFRMDQIREFTQDYLDRWIRETCRAEICHWLAIPPSLLFFLWNPPTVGWIMIAYALAFNLPLIIAQRYNRPKMQRVLKKVRRGKLQRL